MKKQKTGLSHTHYSDLVSDISELLEQARRTAARAVNSVLTATYWEIGHRIVEFEQGGRERAKYGEGVLISLAHDLSARRDRGFSKSNLFLMRAFYLGWKIFQTPSGILEARAKYQTLSGKSVFRQTLSAISPDAFPLSWSHYVRLMSVEKPHARAFYEAEAIRGGWSVRQLDRQISTQYFERVAKSTKQSTMLVRGAQPKPEDAVTVTEEVRDPYLLEFLDLKDEYSEHDLEEALIRHMEWFLLEMGPGFTFVARQKRIRIGTVWYRLDLLLYHRVLRCLVVIDLKRGTFTHADAGQMNLYLNYVKEHLRLPGESDPVGIILCSDRDSAVIKYALAGIRARVFTSKYLTELPNEAMLRREILATEKVLEGRSNRAETMAKLATTSRKDRSQPRSPQSKAL